MYLVSLRNLLVLYYSHLLWICHQRLTDDGGYIKGMTLVPSVAELILAELLYLQYEDNNKPIYLYINSTGTSKVSSTT